MDIAGLWKDIRFDAKHQDDMECVAVVGEKNWEAWATKLSQPFLKADMRFFTPDQSDAVRKWITAPRAGSPKMPSCPSIRATRSARGSSLMRTSLPTRRIHEVKPTVDPKGKPVWAPSSP